MKPFLLALGCSLAAIAGTAVPIPYSSVQVITEGDTAAIIWLFRHMGEPQ